MTLSYVIVNTTLKKTCPMTNTKNNKEPNAHPENTAPTGLAAPGTVECTTWRTGAS